MIITEVFYGIKCDRCGEIFEDGEHSFWSDESSAIENACDSDWKEVNGKYYCTNCCEVNDEIDEIKVFEEYPQQLKTLNKFIDKILKGVSRNVMEEYAEQFKPDAVLSFASKTSIRFAEWIGTKYIWMTDNLWLKNTLEKFDFNSDKKYDDDTITTSELFKMYLNDTQIKPNSFAKNECVGNFKNKQTDEQ